MLKNQSLLSLSAISLALSIVGSGFGSVAVAGTTRANQRQTNTIAQGFNPPDRGAPPTTVGGASRSNCVQSEIPLTPLVPLNNPEVKAVNPAVFVYVPKTAATQAEVVIKDDNDADVSRMTVALPSQPGILQVNLPELEAGKNYHWYFAMICNPQNRLDDVFADGWIERVQPNQQADLWQDTLTALAEQYHQQPGNNAISAQWQEFLNAAGHGNIANAPLFLESVAAKVTE
ncbi:DUF928 domain-containing protein [[Phormidium] sp. ETS-05]|uniref:DUF928 domain-containing protein n=1 Tax=[Phormidium] sp. ETS-05 TaxID=222819 RepID=UPI0018EEF82C|nr:DUF928 domain-containing protein [[Phormidium] sp. ETS-05]